MKPTKSYSFTAICVFAGMCINRGTSFSPAKFAARPPAAPPSCQSHSAIFDPRPVRPLVVVPLRSTASADESPRSKLRQLTGVSLTALRTTLRKATGFSLTALRTTLRAATGISLSRTVSDLLRGVIGILHPALRYFLQPLLIAYYAPLLAIRYRMVGPSREYVEESRRGHERAVEGWRRAVEAAERANDGGYWPVHLNEDGTIETSLPPDPNDVLDLTDGIEKSVAAATVL